MAHFSIVPCPAERQAEALRVLHAGLPADQQLGLVQTLQSVRDQSDAVFAGLLIAEADDQVVGATWVQLTPGKTAVVWLPDASSAAAVDLVEAASTYLDEHVVTLAQFLAKPDEVHSAELLAAGDFRKLADLTYLAADRQCFPDQEVESELQFVSCASNEPDKLGELLIRTYEASLDCPQLNGLREPEDVLEGYQAQGTFAAERWFFVRHESTDVGALILTLHADSGNWELVYMGLVPEYRGRGFGKQILEFAMWQAGRSGAERLVLAVDQRNQPALDTYLRAGFVAWDYRTVYARLRPGGSE